MTADGARASADVLARIKALAIPPRLRVCLGLRAGHGHLQLMGLDARGRKQYRYHSDWAAWRSQVKDERLAAFGAALGRLRRRMYADLQVDAGERPSAL